MPHARLLATDDFRVTAVNVLITGSDGATLEQCAAEQDPADIDRWIYAARKPSAALTGTKIIVQASDRPGNITRAEIVK